MLQPLIKKELRLAAGPLWLVVICSIILVGLAWESGQGIWNPVITWLGFGGICAYLITSQFGSEISLNCLEWGISQPWSRAQYWKKKSLIAFGIYGVVVLVLIGVTLWLHRGDFSRGSISLEEFGFALGVMSWACLGPGIFLVLKYRNMVASMWLACLLPIGLALLIAYPFKINGVAESTTATVVGIAECLYGALGLWLAWRTFLKWEASGCGSVELSIPRLGTKVTKDGRQIYRYRPIRATVIREIKLQKTNMLLGLGCVFFGSLIVGLNKVFPMEYWMGKDLAEMLGLLPEFFRWILFLIPCTMACTSIAEGRRMDVHTSELVAPVSRRLQLGIKIVTVMMLGCLVAVIIPLPLNGVLHGGVFDRAKGVVRDLVIFNSLLSLLVFLVVTIGIYAASMSGSFLKAFSTSLIVLSILPPWLGFSMGLGGNVPGLLSLLIPVGLSVAFLYWRAFRNWCCQYPSGSLLRLNVKQSVVMMAFSMMLVWCVNDRLWERWTINEPQMKPSILKAGVQPGALFSWGRNDGYTATILSPDGTIWLVLDPDNDSHTFGNGPKLETIQLPIQPPKGYWLRLAGGFHRVALDSEHRLWTWTASDESTWIRSKPKQEIPLIELGEGRKWSKFAVGVWAKQRVVAIAEDGSLWRFTQSNLATPMEMSQVDAELPTHHEYDRENKVGRPVFREVAYDWVDCAAKGKLSFALNDKGMLFAWGRTEPVSAWNRLVVPENQLRDLSRYVVLEPFQQIVGEGGNALILTTKDGNQYVAGKSLKLPENTGLVTGNLSYPTMYHIKTDQMIHDLSELYNSPTTRPTFRKTDGTLWEIQQIHQELDISERRYYAVGGSVMFEEKQIGKRDDWVYKARSMGITADGKIWNWNLPIQGHQYAGFNITDWLPPRFRHKVVADLNP